VTERIDEKDRITGNIVCAKVTPRKEENHKEFTKRIKKHCSQKLERSRSLLKSFLSMKTSMVNGSRKKEKAFDRRLKAGSPEYRPGPLQKTQ